MDWRAVQNWVYAHGWSSLCIVAPVLLGFGALVLTASMLMHGAQGLELRYEFLSATDLTGSSTAEVKQIAGKNEQDLAMTFVAKDLHGRTSYAVASAFLYLAAAAAIVFGFRVVRRRDGALSALLALLIFLVAGYLVAKNPLAFDLLRPLVVEKILEAANKQAPPMNFLASGDADHSWFNPFIRFFFPDVDQFGDPTVTGLVRLNSMIGLIAVGMLLAALASASLRPENPPTHEELLSRFAIMRTVLALGATVLVVTVVCSTILIEWPISLLSNSQQTAIAPIGEAVNLMYGAVGTMALIAALGPALVAFVLDRQAFRATLADNRQAGTTEATAQDRAPAPRFADDLGFAPLSSISGAIAVLSPLLASPLLGLLASIVKSSPS